MDKVGNFNDSSGKMPSSTSNKILLAAKAMRGGMFIFICPKIPIYVVGPYSDQIRTA